jgi:GxxExxY protein
MDPNLVVDEEMEPDPELNEWTNKILACGFDVHSEIGPGFAESIYQNALEHELNLRGIPFQRQVKVVVNYKGVVVGEGRIDLIVNDRVIVEIKCVESIASVHVAQSIAYLRATKLKLCLVMNFNVKRLKDGIRRVAL